MKVSAGGKVERSTPVLIFSSVISPPEKLFEPDFFASAEEKGVAAIIVYT